MSTTSGAVPNGNLASSASQFRFIQAGAAYSSRKGRWSNTYWRCRLSASLRTRRLEMARAEEQEGAALLPHRPSARCVHEHPPASATCPCSSAASSQSPDTRIARSVRSAASPRVTEPRSRSSVRDRGGCGVGGRSEPALESGWLATGPASPAPASAGTAQAAVRSFARMLRYCTAPPATQRSAGVNLNRERAGWIDLASQLAVGEVHHLDPAIHTWMCGGLFSIRARISLNSVGCQIMRPLREIEDGCVARLDDRGVAHGRSACSPLAKLGGE